MGLSSGMGSVEGAEADICRLRANPSAPDRHGRLCNAPDKQPAFAGLHRGIGRRLLVYIVLFSSAVTLMLTAAQLYLDYSRDVDTIKLRVAEITSSNQESLARSLWNVDVDQIRLQLDGILRLPDMQAVEVRESVAGVDSPLVVAVGKRREHGVLSWNTPIIYNHQDLPREIGTLYIEATLDEVYHRLQDKVLIILASQGLKTFLVSLFILFIVHRLITRHIVAFSDFAGRYDVRSPSVPFLLHRPKARREDELDQMVAAFNAMRSNLEHAYQELSDTNARLASDIRARRRAEAESAHLAFHDALTDLPNRRKLLERLQREVSVAARLQQHGALLLIDLDHFKNLNEALGHSVGDALLVQVASRLSGCVRDIDMVSRLGGDEFVVLVPGLGADHLTAAANARTIAEKVMMRLSVPYEIDARILHITPSVGVVMFPQDAADTETLLRHADTAMYHAKTEGRNSIRFFRPAMQAAVQSRHELENLLRTALVDEQFFLAYQPLYDAESRLVGAEALIRWQHPTRGVVSPAEFIPVAEETSLIIDIGRSVLKMAARQLRAWQDDSLLDQRYHLAVNVSPKQFHQPDFNAMVREIFDEAGVAPSRLVLEITESVLIRDTANTVAKMEELRSLGVRFYIDDFGTGYSSMSYLKRLPVDGLKIDQSFVRDVNVDANDMAIIEAIVAIAHRFDLVVVAEGVETAEQLAFLRDRQCDMFQGYLFSRPVPAEAFRQTALMARMGEVAS